MDKSYIGLTGIMASGKGEVVKIMEEHGYKYISLSDMVREEAAKCEQPVTRAQMQNIGNRLRSEGGAGVLGKKIREKVSDSTEIDKWVIDGVRNPAEIIELRKLEGFVLAGIEAPVEMLISRIKSRGRATDSATDKELLLRIERERGIGEPPDGQQVGKCLAEADITIHNTGTLEELKDKLAAQLFNKGE